MDYRTETDSIGEKEVPKERYYGVQSLRAAENFQITGRKMCPAFIESLVQIKKAAAIANSGAGLLSRKLAGAVTQACDEIIAGGLREEFIVDPIQGGAGTSANMNANEVIANRAIELLGGKKGDYNLVNPNDHVNMGQSTNDVYPTAGKITVLKLLPELKGELVRLRKVLQEKAEEFDDVVKMGRTQLQDAVPIRLGQEFKAYASMICRDLRKIEDLDEKLKVINMGGTAIGTAINADPNYFCKIVPSIEAVTGLELTQAEDLIDATQNVDVFVTVSSVIKICAVNLSKMCNDLRLMSSGPRTGFGEINLPARQNGSSIMPGKVNPVIPEVVTQIAYHIVGNDLTISMAAEAGQMELNAFEPIIFHDLFESISTLTGGIRTLIDHCIGGITANRQKCSELLNSSVGIVTAIAPYIGYRKAAEIAKVAISSGNSVKSVLLGKGIMEAAQINNILDPARMTRADGEQNETRHYAPK
ncbi:MAG TPA: aspartate ammonia-lyase [Clostridia bacterium]|nr:aspartate ammonia-lyase [Clostridia bacterium]